MGNLLGTPKFDPDRDIPDLTGKVAVVTGANRGLGYAIVLVLASHGAKVYVGCRSEEKCSATIQRLHKDNSALREANRLEPLQLDLSIPMTIRSAAQRVIAKEKHLDYLVNNGGLLPAEASHNADGLEMHFAVNHIGTYILTMELLPLMKSTAKTPGSDVRITTITSYAYSAVGEVDYSSPEKINEHQVQGTGFMGRFKRYGRSKLMNMLFTKELQRRLDEEGVPILCTSLHPGLVQSEGAQVNGPWIIRMAVRYLGITSLKGSDTVLYALTSPELVADRPQFGGAYLEPVKVVKPVKAEAMDPVLASTLWRTTEGVVARVLPS